MRKTISGVFVKNNEQRLFNTAAMQGVTEAMANKRLAKKLKRKIWEMTCSLQVLKSSEILLEYKSAHISGVYACTCVYM